MYNKTMIRFGFCNIQNNQGLGKIISLSLWLITSTCTLTLIILDITTTSSNNYQIDSMLLCVCSVNRSQMTSRCGKNQKVAHEVIAECVTDVLTTFWCPLWSIYWTDTRQHGIYLFYTIKKPHNFSFLFQNLFNYLKAGLCPLWQTRKKAIWRNLLSIQNEAISLVAMP